MLDPSSRETLEAVLRPVHAASENLCLLLALLVAALLTAGLLTALLVALLTCLAIAFLLSGGALFVAGTLL